MNKLIIMLVVLSAITFTSCQKDKAPTTDDVMVEFNFTSPVEDFMYPLGDTVKIVGHISANHEMHGYEIEILNLSNNNESIYYSHVHEDGVMYHVSDYWVNNVTKHSNLEMKVTVVLSHDMDAESNEVSKSYYFMAHPM